MSEKNAYILGTDRDELHRLGYQHQVWSSEARKGWEIAEFAYGQTILDLGCGPGFCTSELAYIVGDEGKVIGVDKSEGYISFLKQKAQLHQLNIDTQCADFNDMVLEDESLDGVFSRWALAWVPNPSEIVDKIVAAMKPGSAIVIHEYYDWTTHQTSPALPALKKGIAAAYTSFDNMEGNINIGRELPNMFYQAGLEVISTRLMSKLGTPEDLNWYWPKTFLHIYLPKLVDMGLITAAEVESALDELELLETIPGATYFSPQMVEVVAVKP